jgi:hypothetical protein
MAARETNAERSPEEIRREIERTRAHMDRAVEAISGRLSPGRFVDELWARAQTEGAAAVAHTLRDHPVPFALIGAGLGWLVMEGARSRGDGVGPGTYAPAEGRVGPYGGEAVDRDDPDWEYASVRARMKGRVADAAHAVGERLADAGHSVTEAGHTLQEKAHAAGERVGAAGRTAGARVGAAAEAVRERVHGAARSASEGARHGADRARDGFWTMLEQNPLALGAITFGLGVAAAAGVPTSRWEDEELGRFSGPLKNEATRAVQETAQKVKGVARDAVGAARDELDRQREQIAHGDPLQHAVAQIKESARKVGRAAGSAARESARAAELTPEGMKKVAEQVRDRTRETTGS